MAKKGSILFLKWDTGWETIVFKRPRQCEEIAVALQFLTGDSIEDCRPVENSDILVDAIKEHNVKDAIVASNFVQYNGTLSYALLTVKEIHIFTLAKSTYDPYASGASAGMLSIATGGKLKDVKEVVFVPDGPVLQIDCQGNIITIDFGDDTGREQWRRGLKKVFEVEVDGKKVFQWDKKWKE